MAACQRPVKIQVALGDVLGRGHGPHRGPVFRGWYEPHVALGKHRALEARHGSQHRDLAVMLDALPEDVLVTGAGHLV